MTAVDDRDRRWEFEGRVHFAAGGTDCVAARLTVAVNDWDTRAAVVAADGEVDERNLV